MLHASAVGGSAHQRKLLVVALPLLLAASGHFVAQAQSRRDLLAVFPRDRIGAQIDGRVTVRLPGSVHPLARPEYDAGLVAGDRVLSRMILVLKRDAAQQAALDAFASAQLDPTSPYYHQWLSNQSYAE